MYFTVAELHWLMLRRQLTDCRHLLAEAKRRGWHNIAKGAKHELARLERRFTSQARLVANDNANRAVKKAEWLEKLA